MMKTFMIEYTEDYGATYHTDKIDAENAAIAYALVSIKLSKDGAITSLLEIE